MCLEQFMVCVLTGLQRRIWMDWYLVFLISILTLFLDQRKELIMLHYQNVVLEGDFGCFPLLVVLFSTLAQQLLFNKSTGTCWCS